MDSIFEKIGGRYVPSGDYLIPDLHYSDRPRIPLGKYGRMRLDFLMMHRPDFYTRLVLAEKLYDHLSEVEETCQKRVERMMLQGMQAEQINEDLKASDQMAWVRLMNNLHQRVEESVMQELIID